MWLRLSVHILAVSDTSHIRAISELSKWIFPAEETSSQFSGEMTSGILSHSLGRTRHRKCQQKQVEIVIEIALFWENFHHWLHWKFVKMTTCSAVSNKNVYQTQRHKTIIGCPWKAGDCGFNRIMKDTMKYNVEMTAREIGVSTKHAEILNRPWELWCG